MTVTLLRRRRRPEAATGPAHVEPTPSEAPIPVAIKTPMSPRPLMAALEPKLTLAEAVRKFYEMRLTDPADVRLLEQLTRELSGPHSFLAVGARGELSKVDAEKTTVGEIAAPREVRTPNGVETAQIAAVEVQAYAPVG